MAVMRSGIFLEASEKAGDSVQLGNAIAYQKSFWKFVGILALVSIAFAIVGIISAILIPSFIALRG